ncbi:hypothetical protein AC630_00655 [Bradyrhizobium sp. AS23.2]|nr:hypothetical protein AC630_00655 [Bradyrhizobium sp. AS23.2]
MAVGDTAQQTGAREAKFLVQRQRGRVVGIDIADHLAEAGRGTSIDQFPEQQPADPAAEMLVVDVDRMLGRVAIGRALAEQHRIGIADDLAAKGCDQMRQAGLLQVLAPVAQIVRFGRSGSLDIARHTIADVMAVDRQHRLDIALA